MIDVRFAPGVGTLKANLPPQIPQSNLRILNDAIYSSNSSQVFPIQPTCPLPERTSNIPSVSLSTERV